jgi:hypothetical protein
MGSVRVNRGRKLVVLIVVAGNESALGSSTIAQLTRNSARLEAERIATPFS